MLGVRDIKNVCNWEEYTIMLNYGNLNDVEFEYLCQDIMSRKLNKSLQRFATGKDGGIDLTDNVVKKNIIVQVKHYVKSDTKHLISSLKKELPKVKANSPKQYYICCSKELTPTNKEEIYRIFSEYMKSPSNIITLLEIDEFLSKEENIDVLRKHFKLWIESTNILQDILTNNIFIDCESLLSTIEDDKKIFVETQAYDLALKYLEKNNVIIILGDPGVGKTMTSKMLILHHAVNNYQVRFTTDGINLNELKKAISRSPDQKEIILLDDCFGQAYFNMKETQENELLALIKYIKLNPNKRLILNSRITIYQEARERTPELVRSSQRDEYKTMLINMSKLSNLEKAKIFYNHLFFNDIPNAYFQDLKRNKNYMQIIKHSNYNPRIIEYVTSSNSYEEISSENYFDFVLQCLNQSERIWKNEYTQRLKNTDRILLTTLYSLSDTTVQLEMVQECYNYRLKSMQNIDSSINHFEQSLKRLQNGFVKIIDKFGEKMLSVANPSINDFLRHELEKNKLEKEKLRETAISIPQLKRILSVEIFEEKLSNLFLTEEIFRYVFQNEDQKESYIVWYCVMHNIQNPSYTRCFQNWIKRFDDINIYEKSFCSAVTVLEKMLSSKLAKFYGIENIIKNEEWISHVFDMYELEDLINLIQAIERLFTTSERIKFIDIAENFLSAAIDWYCDGVPVSEFDIDVSDFYSIKEDSDENIDEADIAENVDFHVKDLVQDQIRVMLLELPQDIQESIPPLWNFSVRVDGSQTLVHNHFHADDYYDEWRESRYDSNTLEYQEIDYIFNR